MNRMMVAVLAMLGGEAAAQNAPVDTSAQLAAFESCLLARAIELDDGRSDARSIAAGLVPACSNTHRALAAATMPGARETQRLMDATRDIAIDRATSIVLRVRAERRKP